MVIKKKFGKKKDDSVMGFYYLLRPKSIIHQIEPKLICLNLAS